MLRFEVPCQRDLLVAMECAAVQIAQVAGMLRMLRIIVYDRSVCRARWSLGRRSLITHIKTFAVHYCWRFLPSVVRILPGLLVGSEAERCDLKLGCSISLLEACSWKFSNWFAFPDLFGSEGGFVGVFGFADRVICVVPVGLSFMSHRLRD